MKQPAYSYMVRLPENPEPGRRYPAVFTLHGRGSNEEDLAALTAHLEGKFILVHIRGDLPAGAGYQYYELQSIGNPMRSQFDAAAAQLEELICYVTEQHPVDPARRYVLGFSQGAILAMTLALVMGSGLKGIIALNGYVPGFVKTEYKLQPLEQVSVFISHGEQDHIFPLSVGLETEAYFRPLAPRLEFRTYPAGHGVTEQNRRDFTEWLIEDAELEAGEGGRRP